ncbi:MAG TPA: ribosomal-protein-alanine N-acetyltransferase [Nitrososphaeria archaeon]|nr:ribosomal protein S18-alanine N-acetyltransferase [Conexivisphaerales archaeon]PMP94535.1 MAG: ribosomal-protein-alanine N-acetyltransferase [Nitrososphaera sp.]HEU16076.1 ribosomal-protein-alanine N-acetyltransferase [Nitrososphaeria archaeon]
MEIDAAAPSGYVVRRATREDLREVIRLNRENLPENYSEEFFEEVLESNPETFLVAEESGADGRGRTGLAGYIMCRVEIGFPLVGRAPLVKKGHVISIAVAPEHRRKGVGMALMVEGMNALRSRGCSEVYLEVRVGNTPAISLYRKLGFRVSRRIPGYYRDGEDAFVMARSL